MSVEVIYFNYEWLLLTFVDWVYRASAVTVAIISRKSQVPFYKHHNHVNIWGWVRDVNLRGSRKEAKEKNLQRERHTNQKRSGNEGIVGIHWD